MKVHIAGDEFLVSGNGCPRGRDYAVREVTNPTRIFTTTVFIQGSTHRMLPVRSNGEIPKDMVLSCIRTLASCAVSAPVRCGDVVVRNILDTGVDIIASRSMERKS
jgi:CxxC motif-containing protein